MGKEIDLTGKQYGRLLVLKRAENHILPDGRHSVMWLCRCVCGNECIVAGESLKKCYTKSCGCLHKQVSSVRAKQLFKKHGKANTRLYRVWASMKTRCYNTNRKSYKNYGGRTDNPIKVCDEWQEFEPFSQWATENGYDKNSTHRSCTLDRIDNSQGYSPKNCRWVDAKVQCNNTRNNHLLTYKGETKTLTQWANDLNITPSIVLDRINKLGWSIDRTLEEPVKQIKKRAGN